VSTATVNTFGFMARMSPRERAMLGVLLVVFFVVAIGVLFMIRRSSFAETRAEIDDLRAGLEMVRTGGQAYESKKKDKEAREARIANAQPVAFTIMIEELEKTLTEGSVRNLEEKPAFDDGSGLIKRVASFEVRNVPLEELLTFLTKIESQPNHILFVERLNLRSPSALEDRLNAEVELTTWELRKVEEAAAAPPPEEAAP
jgi:hypothetical protein